jgi:hypothetical protein
MRFEHVLIFSRENGDSFSIDSIMTLAELADNNVGFRGTHL